MVKIRVPSLREHKEDIGQIANSYWLKLHHHRLKEEQINALMTYDYPGNVRELYNLLECADVLEEQDFNKLIADQRATIGNLASSIDDDTPDELEAVIRRHAFHAFFECLACLYEACHKSIVSVSEGMSMNHQNLVAFVYADNDSSSEARP